MNRATIPTGWVRNPAMISPDLDPRLASSYELGYTSNPLSGCLNRTPEGLCLGGMFPCYAYKLANGRLRTRYLANKEIAPVRYDTYKRFDGELSQNVVCRAMDDPFYPRFWPKRLEGRVQGFGDYMSGAYPKGIFVCDMSDLFGIGIPEEWTRWILENIGQPWYKEHRFYLLTKQPQNLPKWSPFPDNCYVGVTLTRPNPLALLSLDEIEAKIRYISIEPMLARFPEISFDEIPCDWLIIGACTGQLLDLIKLQRQYPSLTLMRSGKKWTVMPDIEWVEEIVRAADQAGVPIFLKDNLKPLFFGKVHLQPLYWAITPSGELRQEMPQG